MRRLAWLFAGMALVAGGPSALAATPPGLVLAYVDMEKLAAGYKAMQELNSQFQQFRAEQDAILETRHKTRLLEEAEQQEYLDLVAMAAPTEERARRLKELEDLCNQRERRLFELRAKTQRTPEEEQEFRHLDELYQRRMKELGNLQQDRDRAVAEKYEELSKILTDNVDAAVKAVAEEQKLTIVLRKEVVLWGGTDITDAVLAKLNAPGGQ